MNDLLAKGNSHNCIGRRMSVVLPTRGEGFNLPAAEALALGLPVITTAYGGQSDFFTEETGWRLDFDFAPSQSHLCVGWVALARTSCVRLARNHAPLRRSKQSRKTQGRRHPPRAKIGQKLIRSVYRWSNTGVMIRAYASTSY